jgi:hypothetical protein
MGCVIHVHSGRANKQAVCVILLHCVLLLGPPCISAGVRAACVPHPADAGLPEHHQHVADNLQWCQVKGK